MEVSGQRANGKHELNIYNFTPIRFS